MLCKHEKIFLEDTRYNVLTVYDFVKQDYYTTVNGRYADGFNLLVQSPRIARIQHFEVVKIARESIRLAGIARFKSKLNNGKV